MIRLEHIVKSFGAHRVLEDVSCEVRKGEASPRLSRDAALRLARDSWPKSD